MIIEAVVCAKCWSQDGPVVVQDGYNGYKGPDCRSTRQDGCRSTNIWLSKRPDNSKIGAKGQTFTLTCLLKTTYRTDCRSTQQDGGRSTNIWLSKSPQKEERRRKRRRKKKKIGLAWRLLEPQKPVKTYGFWDFCHFPYYFIGFLRIRIKKLWFFYSSRCKLSIFYCD